MVSCDCSTATHLAWSHQEPHLQAMHICLVQGIVQVVLVHPPIPVLVQLDPGLMTVDPVLADDPVLAEDPVLTEDPVLADDPGPAEDPVLADNPGLAHDYSHC